MHATLIIRVLFYAFFCCDSWVKYKNLSTITCILDYVYIIGGSDDPKNLEDVSFEVQKVDLKTGELGVSADAIFGSLFPAAKASQNRIAVCGGKWGERILDRVQVFTPSQDQ